LCLVKATRGYSKSTFNLKSTFNSSFQSNPREMNAIISRW
jgi:hypothetical protein